MKKNKLFKVVSLCMAMAVVLIMGVAFNVTKTKAKADGVLDWFEKVSVKKCAISLPEDTFEWTGKAIKPEVEVNYKGTMLKKNVDYVLSYVDNMDAGTGKVIIEGKGNYKGKETMYFTIEGVDFERECLINIKNKKVEVYYKNQLLREEVDYRYTVLRQAQLVQSVPAGNKYLNTYNVTYYYTITGQGKYDGAVMKKEITTEVEYENITWTEEED